MIEFYIWDIADLATAQAALDALNNNERLPLVGKNAKTGQLEPNKQKTTKWTDEVKIFVNGTVGFQRINDSLLTALGISDVEKQLWLDTYNPSIVEYDPAWEPTEEE